MLSSPLSLKKTHTSRPLFPKQTILAPPTLGCQISENTVTNFQTHFSNAFLQQDQEPGILNSKDFPDVSSPWFPNPFHTSDHLLFLHILFSLAFSYAALFRFVFFSSFSCCFNTEIPFSLLFPQILIFLLKSSLYWFIWMNVATIL